jgi:predicted AAA+ superfamily ATPase
MSLSDRFGLMITFQMPTREHFLDITMQIAEERGIQAPCEEIAEGVERYALERGYRSPRIAKQYLDLTYNTREN